MSPLLVSFEWWVHWGIRLGPRVAVGVGVFFADAVGSIEREVEEVEENEEKSIGETSERALLVLALLLDVNAALLLTLKLLLQFVVRAFVAELLLLLVLALLSDSCGVPPNLLRWLCIFTLCLRVLLIQFTKQFVGVKNNCFISLPKQPTKTWNDQIVCCPC